MKKYVKIKSIVSETKDAFTIKFEHDPIFNSYRSGQFLNVFVKINGEEVSRSYSFSSAPIMERFPAITIKRIKDGLVSSFLYEKVEINESLLISEPSGRFQLQDFGNELKVFIAGGSGITPIFSMIKTLLFDSSNKVLLLYANKSFNSTIFRRKISELQEQFQDRFKAIHFLDELPEASQSFNIEQGRIDKEALLNILSDIQMVDSVYLCGPIPMMESLTGYLYEMGIGREKIFSENFNPSMKDYTVQASDQSLATLNVLIDQKSSMLKVYKSKSILQSAMEQGLKLPHSCMEALCGSCKVKLLKGQVNMVENYSLTSEEVGNGLILACSSLPVSDEIELEY